MLHNALTTKLSQKNHWCKLKKRSKVIRGQMWWTVCYGSHIWSKKTLMQAKNDDDLHGGCQRSSEVKCGKLCCGYHIWSKELLMLAKDDDDLHRGQRSSEVKCGKLCAVTTILYIIKNHWCKLWMMITFMEVKGQQRSNIVNYASWLPNFVRRTADASLGWWLTFRRSKVNRGQI